jgi:urease accessory protein
LASFLVGRLHTAGVVDASFAAAACAGSHAWPELDAHYDARTVSPRLRAVSRTLGRQLLRSGRRVFDDPLLDTVTAASPIEGAHHAVALGAVARAARLDELDAATAALHHLASTVATSAVRLLGLDPFDVYARLARLAPLVDTLAAAAAADARQPLEWLPAASAPLVEILAEDHATWEVRLFAS